MSAPHRILLGVSGASGMPYALALARALAANPGIELHVTVSGGAREVLRQECGSDPAGIEALAHTVHPVEHVGAPPASGSYPLAAMVVCPCSMASLAAIATGVGSNLIHRAADVCLKERRKLVLVTREMPLSRIHLRNMLSVTEAGAVVCHASPGFYHAPKTVDDLVRQVACRVLDALGVENSLAPRWGVE